MKIKNDSGAVLVVIAIIFVVLLGFAALAIDIGYIFVARNELQNVADGAALAASRKLGSIYQALPYDEQMAYDCSSDKNDIFEVANSVALSNKAAGKTLDLNREDVIVGQWSEWRQLAPGVPKTENLSKPDAVHVIVRRDSLANGPVATFFARLLSINTINVTAQATAALSGKSTATPGELQIPVGISRYWFDNHSCNDHIKFSPTNDPDSCAGWNSFTYNSNDSTIRKILEEDSKYDSPETIAGQTSFNFIGGDLSKNTFDAMMDLFQKYGNDVDINGNPIIGPDGEPLSDATGHPDAVPIYDTDGSRLIYNDGTPRNKHEWQTYVVVYDWADCSNPNKSIKIVGFAQVNLTDILGPPDKVLEGVVLCDYVDPEDNRGGGGEYGVNGSIPGLVE